MEAKWIRVREVGRHVGEEVELRGWLYDKRSSGKVRFLLVRDGSGILQAVLAKPEASDDLLAQYDVLTQESALIVRGMVREDARAPGGYELAVREIELVHRAEGYPITPKEHGIEFLLDHRHLWLRSRRPHAVLRIRAEVIRAAEEYLQAHGYLRVDAPILTPLAVEGTTTLFKVDYFDRKAYLTQSGQLYMEAAAMAFGRVYCLGPTFRAEKSKTRRHLTEFWMLEPEAAYLDLDGCMALAEGLVVAIVEAVLDRCRRELGVLGRETEALERVRPPFARISYDEAVRRVNEAGLWMRWGEDFGGDEETILSRAFDRPVFVHRYPAACKAFYMQPDPERPEVVLNFDLLAPEGYGEIVGGGQRIHDLSLLERRLSEHGLPPQPYAWYLDLRRYGSVPHAGFGLGIERTVAWICGLDHVREAIPFPRLLYRLGP
ncbi:MAG: asparagine--tRNA ligase [Armatimonadetes bacterium]|nr:asparagine--tRNA ligase [Armatimonadota bacterium]MDW8153506.1 asparagine--tRNA ligase [Armatimonadota bacterium]